MSDKARAMVVERGKEDWDSEFQRFPRLFQGHESSPERPTWPTPTFNQRATFHLGKRRVDLQFLGRAHTAGDIVAFVPDANVMFTGDIVEFHSACYCGDGHFSDWPATWKRSGPSASMRPRLAAATGISLTGPPLWKRSGPSASMRSRPAAATR